MKKRLDQILVDRGLVETKSKGQSLIMSGNVLVGDQVVTKSGTMVAIEADISLKETLPYVSRGGVKLKGAIDHFGINFQDQVVLDVGASTGGFTDCVLQEGAQHVFCIDVGKNQLHEKLQNHPQVTWKESFHVKDLTRQTFDRSFDWIVMDVSFISILKVIPYLLPVLNPNAHMLILFKPQFEVQKKDLVKGVVKNETKREETLTHMIQTLKETYDFSNIQWIDSPIQGPKGNQETILFIQT